MARQSFRSNRVSLIIKINVTDTRTKASILKMTESGCLIPFTAIHDQTKPNLMLIHYIKRCLTLRLHLSNRAQI